MKTEKKVKLEKSKIKRLSAIPEKYRQQTYKTVVLKTVEKLADKIGSKKISIATTADYDKSGNIVASVLRSFGNTETVKKYTIDKSLIAKLKSAKSIKEYRSLLREMIDPNHLGIDPTSKNMGLHNSGSAGRVAQNKIAKLLGSGFTVEYGKK